MTAPIEQAPERRSRVATTKLVLIGVLLVLFGVFAVQNAASVSVEFLGWEFQMRRIVLMLLSACMGIAIWELAGLTRRRRKERQDGRGA